MVPAQADDLGVHLLAECQDGLDAALSAHASIDVVAEEDNPVAGPDLVPQLVQQIHEGRKAAVDVADRNRGHTVCQWVAAQ